jgi:hypothetical protein
MVHECVVTIFNIITFSILTLFIKDVPHNGTQELSVVMSFYLVSHFLIVIMSVIIESIVVP